MLRNVILMIYGGKEEFELLINLFKNDDKLQLSFNGNNLEIHMNGAEEEDITSLISNISEKGYKYNYFESREYTKSEKINAEFFDLYINYPWQIDQKSAKDYGTMYDGEGELEQISDLIVDTKKIGKNHICTINPELIVSEEFYNTVIEKDLSGCSFGKVTDYKNRQGPSFYQLNIENVLPEMSKKVRTMVESDRLGITTYLKSEIIYEKEQFLKKAKDFNLTYEYFDNFKMQRVIVSKAVIEVIKFKKIKLNFDPIFFD